GLTPLHFAALVGDAEITEFFLSRGADPNALSHYGETPLHFALSKSIQGSKYRDAWNKPRWRLENLWDVVEFYDEEVQDEVATQITKTRRAVAETLLRDNKTNVMLQDAKGLSLLHTINYTELDPSHVVRSLIQKWARVTARNLKGQTALHLASLAGHLDTVKALLSQGSVIEIADDEGRTVLHYAAKSRNTQIVISILGAYQGDVPDFLNIRDSVGRNALHHLVGDSCFVQFDIMRTLLNLGANTNNTDDYGNSPLAHYLSQCRFFTDLSIYQLLLSHGTRAKSVNKAGKTLAELYAMYGEVDIKVLQLLKDYDVDIDKTNSKGMNLLHTITLRGSLTEEALIYL
ncbi:ankyrin repeat-containing domain protein, partial [Cadophora sp. MPI-SDFR-AT-0126]